MPLELEDRERRGRDEGHVEGRLEPGHRVIGDEWIRGEEQRRDQRGRARAPLEAARQRPHGDDRARMQHQADYFHELQQVVRAEPERQRRDPEPGEVRESFDRRATGIERQSRSAHEVAGVAERDVGVVDDLGPVVESVRHAERHAGEEARDQPEPVGGGGWVGGPLAHNPLSSDVEEILTRARAQQRCEDEACGGVSGGVPCPGSYPVADRHGRGRTRLKDRKGRQDPSIRRWFRIASGHAPTVEVVVRPPWFGDIPILLQPRYGGTRAMLSGPSGSAETQAPRRHVTDAPPTS